MWLNDADRPGLVRGKFITNLSSYHGRCQLHHQLVIQRRDDKSSSCIGHVRQQLYIQIAHGRAESCEVFRHLKKKHRRVIAASLSKQLHPCLEVSTKLVGEMAVNTCRNTAECPELIE